MKRLSVRLLLFNILLIFLPLGSLLYLDTYEKQLLENQEQSMIQQGRIFSAALNGEDIKKEAERITRNMKMRVDSRIRVLDAEGNLLADTASHPLDQPADVIWEDTYYTERNASQTALYRTLITPVRVLRKLAFPPETGYGTGEFYSAKNVLLGEEVRAALEGRYGAITRISSGGQVSVNLYSAIPVWSSPDEEKVTGVILVSRSTYRILLDLYEIRLDIMKIFLISLIVAILISLALSLTITKPLHRLRRQAAEVLDNSGRFQSHFTDLKRKDEIGALSRSLSGLSENLEKRIGFIDQFTADMLHELKNPLAVIRGSAEMSMASKEKEEKLLATILEEEQRMERLLSRLKEISSLDNRMDMEEPVGVDLNQLLPVIAERYPHKDFPDIQVSFISKVKGKAWVKALPDRIIQMIVNPLDNSVSFSPAGSTVKMELCRDSDWKKTFRITVEDEGPGPTENSTERVFDRFYSDRNDKVRKQHSGLGLSIVKSIAEKYGGECRLEKKEEGGARFILQIPEEC